MYFESYLEKLNFNLGLQTSLTMLLRECFILSRQNRGKCQTKVVVKRNCEEHGLYNELKKFVVPKFVHLQIY